ncbi:MAG: DUF3048 domain-containing protein [Actinobacteria bacterium]|jgi:hypothetical protein|nr:DUF3048 domain-containing protein [Actinomycetota bacterium]NDF41587.1 DUF3048 domain-containing protein [Actinomycetota bacterium]
MRKYLSCVIVGALTMLVSAPVHADGGVSPLSGRPGGEGKPVVMVKLDNTALARPHTGLREADLVYVEEVEWGLTRLAALYNSSFPKVVGPVRSARISDLEILKQFDSPGLVFSGANKTLLGAVAKSNAVSLSPNEMSNYYFRNNKKEVPHNQMLNFGSLVSKAKGLGVVGDVGLVFNNEVPTGGTKTKSFLARWASATVGATWSKAGWGISVDGYVQKDYVTKQPVVASSVIIQFVEQYDSKYGDRFGGKTPLARTIGSGNAVILRNGQRFSGTWSRPTAESGTQYVVNGETFPLPVGQVWVILVNRAKPTSVSFK